MSNRFKLKNSLPNTSSNFYSKLFSQKRAAADAVSALIMFIAVIGITAVLIVAIQNYALETRSSMDVQNEVLNNQLRTAIQITNIYYNVSSETIYVYLKNIGDTKLVTDKFDFFLDDEFIYNYSVKYASNLSKNMSILITQNTAVFTKQKTISSGSHKVKLVSGFGGNGDIDYFNN